MVEGSFDEAIQGVDGVFHTASPVLVPVDKNVQAKLLLNYPLTLPLNLFELIFLQLSLNYFKLAGNFDWSMYKGHLECAEFLLESTREACCAHLFLLFYKISLRCPAGLSSQWVTLERSWVLQTLQCNSFQILPCQVFKCMYCPAYKITRTCILYQARHIHSGVNKFLFAYSFGMLMQRQRLRKRRGESPRRVEWIWWRCIRLSWLVRC